MFMSCQYDILNILYVIFLFICLNINSDKKSCTIEILIFEDSRFSNDFFFLFYLKLEKGGKLNFQAQMNFSSFTCRERVQRGKEEFIFRL